MQSGKISKRKTKADQKEQDAQFQDLFVSQLAGILNDQRARDLRCYVSSGKSCACISKYIFYGSKWKEANIQKFHQDVSNGQILLQDDQIARAHELIGILNFASELKKEKCYDSNEASDGKTVKELRGLIGLGNGRKRSKKYELFVLENRELLREQYSLCEKAAQKILGYSINFLYKKLRTNPEKTSRLGATSKTDKDTKSSRQLIAIKELQSKALTGQDQCCSRNCIGKLVTQQLQKIEEWRKRLEGCSQRVAQEIVAEVLLEAASLDGPASFCQNVVQWVTGCSFKKIRRVRDHLKKDPRSLPEHGLKKYWKDKERIQASGVQYDMSATSSARVTVTSSCSGQEAPTYSMHVGNSVAMARNQNNSSNRYTASQMDYQVSASPKPPPNQSLSMSEFDGTYSASIPNESATSVYQQLGTTGSQPVYVTRNPYNQATANDSGTFMPPNITLQQMPPMNTTANFPSSQLPQYNNHLGAQSFVAPVPTHGSESLARQLYTQNSFPIAQNSQFTELQSSKQGQCTHAENTSNFQMLPSLVANFDPNVSNDNQQYFIAAHPDQLQQDMYQTGMTPFIIAQAQQMGQSDDSASAPKQSFFLFSPPPVSDSNSSNVENWPQFVPLTPLYPHQSIQVQSDAVKTDSRQSVSETQIVLSSADSEMATTSDRTGSNLSDQSNNLVQVNQGHFTSSFTPVAIMQGEGSIIPGWYATQQAVGDGYQRQVSSADLFDSATKGNSAAEQQQLNAAQVTEAPQQFFQLQNINHQFVKQQVPLESSQSFHQFFVSSEYSARTGEEEPRATNAPEIADEVGKSAAVCDRNARFSRDRLRATIDSPCVVSILTPVAPVMVERSDSEHGPDNVQSDASGNPVQVFNFPPTHVSRRMAALRMEGPPAAVAVQSSDKAPESKLAASDQRSPGAVDVSKQGKKLGGSLGSTGSIGFIPDDLLQSNEPLLTDLSGVKSLPILNLPSAGWSNETIQVKADQSGSPKAEKMSEKMSSQPEKPSSVKAEALNSSQPDQEIAMKSLSQVPMKKKRKAENSNPRGVANQKQIRFHIFTPNDFANGQVNVSQFRKPSVYASRIPSLTDPEKKRGQKAVKEIAPPDVQTVVKSESERNGEYNAEKADTNAENKPTFEPASIDKDVKDANAPAEQEPLSQMPHAGPVSTLPLKTPAILKNFPPNIKMVVSSESSNPLVPVQLNTPVFVHSGKLLTPCKLNSATVFHRVSPGQPFNFESTSSTPHFFNFMPGFFASVADAKNKSSKSSESSEELQTDKLSSTPLNRSHMTLNLTGKTHTSDDSLQTPSKILVVTPSGMLNTKLTPDLQPAFNFQEIMEKFSPGEIYDKSVLGKLSPNGSNSQEDASPDRNSTAVDPTESSSSSKLDESRLPSIVVDEGSCKETFIDSTDEISLSNEDLANARRRSEGDGKLVIALDESPKQLAPPSPLDTPTAIQVVTPTASGPSASPGKNRFPSIKLKPQSLAVSSTTSQVSTPTLYMVSPSQRSAPSPSVVLFPYSQKNSALPSSSLLSPAAFGFIPRPSSSGGGHSSLRKSALTKKLPIFQFPPAPKPNSDAAGEKSRPVNQRNCKVESPSVSASDHTTDDGNEDASV